ncbi:MAG: phosphoribosyl-ATP diphosphatase [Clostridiales bacterium]|nr:phosphoribosyl-ATP diphosphatase [Clostridiales bacterium]
MSDLGNILTEEFEVIKGRKENPEEGSYTSYLLKKGEDKILKKIGEEASEVIIASKGGNNEELIGEICDVLFHIEVLLAQKGLSWDDVEGELVNRRSKTHMNVEKEAKRAAENRTDETKIN